MESHINKCDEYRNECERLKVELEQSVKFKDYFMDLYGQGLKIANWHLNGDLDPLDSFVDSACEAEQLLEVDISKTENTTTEDKNCLNCKVTTNDLSQEICNKCENYSRWVKGGAE